MHFLKLIWKFDDDEFENGAPLRGTPINLNPDKAATPSKPLQQYDEISLL